MTLTACDLASSHHITYRDNGGDHSPPNLVTVCRNCHRSIHRGYLVVTSPTDFTNPDGHPLQRHAPAERSALDFPTTGVHSPPS